MMRGRLGAALRVALVLIALAPRSRGATTSLDHASLADQSAGQQWAMRKKAWLAGGVATVVLAAIAGAIVFVSGIVPIKASSGHWAITAWLLDVAKQRSVSTHTIGTRVPPLEGAALAMKGAAHFEFGCAPCHGSPVLQQPTIASRMTPTPPDLRQAGSTFEPAELFYIVKHGIKFTGMPAWPAHTRDDEVWAMVAFLRRLPSLDARGYVELAAPHDAADMPDPLESLTPPRSVPDAIRESCARCHGADGLGRGTGAFPKLAGQRPAYLLASLEAYARGQRHSGIMQPAAAPLDRDEMRQIAEYYSGLDGGGSALGSLHAETRADTGAEDLGRRIATRGLPDQLIPPCIECHGPGEQPRNPHYPRLAGQYAEYLELQLRLFKAGQRGGTSYASIMHKVASRLSEDQMQAVASYLASTAPPVARPTGEIRTSGADADR
ncbi:MAG TPA: c-type cytochrome [Vicinamibacterales bacterium]|nr:c-type cytochrome [Vicinamibacterales bacterium]